MTDTKIFLLLATGPKNLGLAPGDLRYFHSRFIARPMIREWALPPLEFLGKSKKLRDFVSWMESAPVVSEKVMHLVGSLCGEDVEFLPFHDIKGEKYFAMNVLRLASVIDLDKSDVTKYDDSDEIITINAFGFRDGLENLPPIFKDPLALSTIFVTQDFAKLAIEHGLTGLALADPSMNQFGLVVRGIDPNVVEGVIT